MLITFDGKRVIVAGAARGIGHAIAVAFTENGGEVTVNTGGAGFLRTSPDYEPQWEGWGPEGQKAFVERIAMRRMGTPDDIAHAVMFLASDYASWITGQILPVMGSPN